MSNTLLNQNPLSYSLAGLSNPQLTGNQNTQFPSLDLNSMFKDKFSADSLASGLSAYNSNAKVDANGNPITVPIQNNGFFTEGNSTMQNIGEGLGLASAGMSLASMLDNWGLAKKAAKTNIANVQQQMGQSKEAFDRSKARQDRTLAAINSANSLANQNVYGG